MCQCLPSRNSISKSEAFFLRSWNCPVELICRFHRLIFVLCNLVDLGNFVQLPLKVISLSLSLWMLVLESGIALWSKEGCSVRFGDAVVGVFSLISYRPRDQIAPLDRYLIAHSVITKSTWKSNTFSCLKTDKSSSDVGCPGGIRPLQSLASKCKLGN